MTIDAYADLRGPRPVDAEPMAYWRLNERAILARLREQHPDEADEWATWENVMRVRHGDGPKRRRGERRVVSRDR